jgi:nickel-dependent lactate racemase
VATIEETIEIALPYGEGTLPLRIAARNLFAVLEPNPVEPCADPVAEIRRALNRPIAMARLSEAARGASRVVIVADDLTRQTPVDVIIPLLLEELHGAGVSDDQVTVIIALGTHRPMTQAEIDARFGTEVTSRVRVINNPWQDRNQLINLGPTANGTPIWLNREAYEADFVIGVGSIVPHHIPGYSGGAKIIQPGISGPETTGHTHFLSTRTRRSYLGLLENPLRDEIEHIGDMVGLKTILNTVLDTEGRLVRAFFGDSRTAFRIGAALAREVYGAPLGGQADIVIAGSHPCDIEFWQAHKSLYPADIAVKEGGTIIVVTPCPEGVAVTHQEMLNITPLSAARIESMINDGEVEDVVSGGLALAWAKMRERAQISLVSDGISRTESKALGFRKHASVDDALSSALKRYGSDASVTVMTHAPEMLPILQS